MQTGQNDVLDCIRGTLALLIGVDRAHVVPDARWQDFGADRFDFFAVLRDVQKRYGIEIPDDDAFEMEKVGDLIKFVEAVRCRQSDPPRFKLLV